MVVSTLVLIALSLAAYLGFALLALSQTRHWRRVGEPARLSRGRVIILRFAGGGMVGLAFILSLMRDGPSFGALLWATTISIAALAMAFTLSWRPRLLRPLIKVAAVLFAAKRQPMAPGNVSDVAHPKKSARREAGPEVQGESRHPFGRTAMADVEAGSQDGGFECRQAAYSAASARPACASAMRSKSLSVQPSTRAGVSRTILRTSLSDTPSIRKVPISMRSVSEAGGAHSKK